MYEILHDKYGSKTVLIMKTFPRQSMLVLKTFTRLFGFGRDQKIYSLQQTFEQTNHLGRRLSCDKMILSDFQEIMKTLEFYNFVKIEYNRKDYKQSTVS